MAKLRNDNKSGYLGVSRLTPNGKWGAYIRRDGIRQYLGSFETAEAAHEAYVEADARLSVGERNPRALLLHAASELFAKHGPPALTTASLNKSGVSEGKLRRVGLNHAALLAELGATDAYGNWRDSARSYRGVVKPKWTWERAIEVAKKLVEQDRDLPTVQECRMNGRSQLCNAVVRSGHTWEDLRVAVGLPSTIIANGRPRYFVSRTGDRWRSRAEACLSNFLYARGVKHRRGDRYPKAYEVESGRAHGRYDLHFDDKNGQQIDVEVWGDIPDEWSRHRYSDTRKKKEDFQAGRATFLGISYTHCLVEAKLVKELAFYIGVIEPFQFDKPQDKRIDSSHWSDADEMIERCRELAASMPDGIFPNEQWLRKRGKYANRPGNAENTLAVYVRTQLKGTRNVREILGQADASTTAWTRESAIEAWRQFEMEHGLSPSQLKSKARRNQYSPEIVREAQRIHASADRLGALDEARRGVSARVKWTPELTLIEWRRFYEEFGLVPTQCMSAAQRQSLPRAVTDRATNIYAAARRLRILDEARKATAERGMDGGPPQ